MKKRFLALTLALTMAMGMTMTAFAAENGTTVTKEENEGEDATAPTVKVSYTTTESYEVTIPADTELKTKDTADGYYATGDVEAKNVLLKEGAKLTVSLASGNSFYLQYGTDNPSKIAYTIKAQETVAEGQTAADADNVTGGEPFLTVEPKTDGTGGVASKTTTLTYAATKTAIEAATKAGTHTDTLTFTVTVVPPNNTDADND